MSELLFDLPVSIISTVLGEWVELSDLTRLDTAYCNHSRRESAVTLLCSEGLCSRDTYRLQYNTAAEMWDWVLKRNVKVTHVTSDCSRLRAEDALEYVKTTSALIRHLDITKDGNIFAQHCTKLETLSCHASFDDQLSAVLLGNPNLHALKLTGAGTKKTEDICRTIKLDRLTQLSFVCDDEPRAVAVLGMATRLLKLEVLGATQSFPALGQHCPHIRSLQVCGWQQVRGLDIVDFTSYCPHIIHLDLDMCNTVTDSDLLGIVRNLRGLQSIRLHAYEFVLTDKGIHHITQHCADTLEVFHIKFCTWNKLICQDALYELRTRCTKLHTFHCVGNLRVSQDLHCLTVLQLSYDNLSNPVLKSISDNCPELQVIDFYPDVKYKRCTEKGFGVLFTKCTKLRTIVAGPADLPVLGVLLRNFSQVKVTRSDRSYRYELMEMPI